MTAQPENPFFAEVTLVRPENLSRWPTVSLHLLVKNGESCVGRLLDNVGPYINEVVAVVNDTTDKTIEVLQAKAAEHDLRLDIIEVTFESHPELYLLDVPETYQQGNSLLGEEFQGPFTEKPLLADWAGIRNLGWDRCSMDMDWKLFLDADDVVTDPEMIPSLCLALEDKKIDMAASQYIYDFGADGVSRGDSYRERLVKNGADVRWVGITHESLKGPHKAAHIAGSLIVRDKKDSTGSGLRVPGRCFKVLYHHARIHSWLVSPRELIYMAMEARLTMPALAAGVLDLYLERSSWPEERAWACAMQGEICEVRKDYDLASDWYESALAEYPGAKAAFRLCRARFFEGKWQEAVDAYHLGVKNQKVVQLLDNGPAYENASKILVAACLRKLDRVPEAIEFCKVAREAFPTNAAVSALLVELESSQSGMEVG